MASKPNFLSRVADLSLRDVGRAVGRATYAVARPYVDAQTENQLQAMKRLVKAYEDLGTTEIGNYLNSQFSDQPAENLNILSDLYRTHPWVFVCTSYIATALAGIPLRVMQAAGFEDGREVLEGADETPVGQMFRWVNPLQSPFEFNQALVSWLLLTGEAYVVYTPPGPDTPPGIPHEMYVLFSPFVKKVTSATSGFLGVTYHVGAGKPAFYPAEDLVYFQEWSPVGRFRGQGAAAAGIGTIQTDMSLREFNRRVLGQGVHMAGTLETENDQLDADQAETIRQKFMQMYGGSSNAHKVAVLWGGLKFNPQTILQKDVMMDSQVTKNRDEVIALFGLKPELLTEKFANKATAETVRRMALEDTILGRYGRHIKSVWDATGLRRFGPEYRVQWDTRDVPGLQTSQQDKIDAGALAIQSGQMTVNEVRTQIHNLPPVDGLEGDVLLVNGQPLALTLTAPAPDRNPDPQDPEDDAPDQSKRIPHHGLVKTLPPGTDLGRRLLDAGVANVVVKATHDDFRIRFDRNRQAAENRVHLALRSVYSDMQKEVLTLVTRSTVNSDILARVEKVMFYEGRNLVVRDFQSLAKDAADRMVAAEVAALGIETVFDVKPVRALRRLANQEQRIRNMQGRSWVKLRGSLRDGLASGESQLELTRRVDAHFQGMKNNAETVARTEILPVVNGATMDVADAAYKAGVNIRSVWDTAEDEKVRTPPRDSKNHLAAHGLAIIPGQEMFVVSGQRMEYPGDSWNGASADNTINCRCGVRNEVRAPGERWD